MKLRGPSTPVLRCYVTWSTQKTGLRTNLIRSAHRVIHDTQANPRQPDPSVTVAQLRDEPSEGSPLSLFGRRTHYDRKRLLDEAERARGKGRDRQAIALYRRVLAAEPRNIELNYRVAPLLAKTGQAFDAWRCFQQVASSLSNGGQRAKALAVYQEAARHVPREFDTWMAVARLQLRLGEKSAARESLLEGRQYMNRRRDRPQAIALLRTALDLEAWHPDTVIDLATLLEASRQGEEARWLLEQLSQRARGRELARIRGYQWRMEPSLRHTWYWIRDAIRARRNGPDLLAAA